MKLASSKLFDALLKDAQLELDNKNWAKAESIAEKGAKLFPQERLRFQTILDEAKKNTDLIRSKFVEAKGLYESRLIDKCLTVLGEILVLDPGYENVLKLKRKALDWQEADRKVEEGWKLFDAEDFEEALVLAKSVLKKIAEHDDAKRLEDAVIEASVKPVGEILSGSIKLYVEGSPIDFVSVTQIVVLVAQVANLCYAL